jgi:PAN domain
LRSIVVLVLLLGALTAAYWLIDTRTAEPDYELVNGQLVRVNPNSTKTVIGPIRAPAREDTNNVVPPKEAARVLAPARQNTSADDSPILAPPVSRSENAKREDTAIQKTTTAVPSATPITNYNVHINRDLEGGDIETLKNIELQSCVSACRTNLQCRAYSFDNWNRYCFLKSAMGTLRLDPRSITGIREDLPAPPTATSAIIMERYRSKAFPGAGYKTLGVAQWETCQTACRNEASCVAYTFKTNDQRCYLFDRTGEYFPDNLANSGGKRQPP